MKTIVVVDDEPIMGNLLEFQLTEAGFKPHYFQKAKDALEQIPGLQPDIIISDIMMPEMDGYEFHRRLRQNPETGHIPFIFLTARTGKEDELAGLELGVEDYIGKPPVIEILVKRIEKVLERSRQRKRSRSEAVFSGNLSQISLHRFVYIIEVSRKTGELSFSGIQNDTHASIWFQEGYFIKARHGKLTGKEALYELMAERDGFLEFYERPVDESSQKKMDNNAILLKGEYFLEKSKELYVCFPYRQARLSLAVDPISPKVVQRGGKRSFQTVKAMIEGGKTVREIVNNGLISSSRAATILVLLHHEGLLKAEAPGTRTGRSKHVEGIAPEILEVLRMAEKEELTGKLSLSADEGTSEIHFKNGVIVHAIHGSTRQRKALYRIFRKNGCTPQIVTDTDVNKNGMHWPLAFLLEEGGREATTLQRLKPNIFQRKLRLNGPALRAAPEVTQKPAVRHILPLVHEFGTIDRILDASLMTDLQTLKYISAMVRREYLLYTD